MPCMLRSEKLKLETWSLSNILKLLLSDVLLLIKTLSFGTLLLVEIFYSKKCLFIALLMGGMYKGSSGPFDGGWTSDLNIIHKIKFFLWKCWLNCPPVSCTLAHIDTNCLAYSTSEETILHLLRDCNVANKFWLRSNLPCSLSASFNLDFKNWLYKFSHS